jgi:YgiT-type zinc finger domain-containing protein
MLEPRTSTGERQCPICGEGTLRSRIISERFEFRDGDRVVFVETREVPLEDCDFCGESFSGPRAAKIRHEATARALGLLSPDQIREIRESSGQSPADFAMLIGVDEPTLIRWERGRILQDESDDRKLRRLWNRSGIVTDEQNIASRGAVIPNGARTSTDLPTETANGSTQFRERPLRAIELD